MSEDASAWLDAYIDGELQPDRMEWVAEHLDVCAACSAELDQLSALRALLQESPAPPIPSERFAARIQRRLPVRPEQPAWQRALEAIWRVAPLAVLATGVFGQVVLWVSGAALATLHLVPGARSAMPVSLGSTGLGWLRPLSTLLTIVGLDEIADAAGGALGAVAAWSWIPLMNLLFVGLIVLAYWSWLASWWARQQHAGAPAS